MVLACWAGAWLLPYITAAHADSARLTLGAGTLTFPNADPDLFPTVSATENPIAVSVRVTGRPASQSQLTALSAGDLTAGGSLIPISAVGWTAQGRGFLSGILSKDSPQLMGQWVGSVNEQGSQQFSLANSWSYATGNYSQTVVYTLVVF